MNQQKSTFLNGCVILVVFSLVGSMGTAQEAKKPEEWKPDAEYIKKFDETFSDERVSVCVPIGYKTAADPQHDQMRAKGIYAWTLDGDFPSMSFLMVCVDPKPTSPKELDAFCDAFVVKVSGGVPDLKRDETKKGVFNGLEARRGSFVIKMPEFEAVCDFIVTIDEQGSMAAAVVHPNDKEFEKTLHMLKQAMLTAKRAEKKAQPLAAPKSEKKGK